jgi:hypothetical protein
MIVHVQQTRRSCCIQAPGKTIPEEIREREMRKFILLTVSAMSLAAAGSLMADRARAAPFADELRGAAPLGNIEKVQFYGGHQYCWYLLGWHGPGWYWCGFADHAGFGWGGGEGWRGFHHEGGGGGPPVREERRPGPPPGGPKGGHDEGHRPDTY